MAKYNFGQLKVLLFIPTLKTLMSPYFTTYFGPRLSFTETLRPKWGKNAWPSENSGSGYRYHKSF